MTICLLDFQPKFVPLVESGLKPHTIRALRVDGKDPLPGDTLHLYTGLRTKVAWLIRREVCAYTVEVTIQPSAGNVHHVLLGGRPIDQHDVETLATIDGFQDGAAFVRFFEANYGLPFTGLLIGWEPAPVNVTRH